MRWQHRSLAAVVGISLALLIFDARGQVVDGPPSSGPESFNDPVPIRRVLLREGDLERIKPNTLIRLPRAKFEERVQNASKAARNAATPPQLVKAHYRAKLIGDRLDDNSLTGTGEWKISSAGPAPGLLPLNDLQIALKEARWTDNRAAVIGFLEPSSPASLAMLVEEEGEGERSLNFEWSARGLPEPGELRFDLAVPAAPIASLELELPGRLRPIFPQDDVLVIGPSPVDDAGDRKSWQILFGGLSHLEISLRPTIVSGQPAPPIQATVTARHDLTPGQAICQATMEFKVLRGDVMELLVDHDPDLTVTDVAILNLESWRSLSGTVAGKKRLSVRFREPARGGQLRLSGVAALPFNDTVFWTSPAIHIAGAIPRGETIRLNVHPDLRMVEWRPGSHRLLRQDVAADHSQTLLLESGLLSETLPAVVRPSARFRAVGVEFRVKQRTEWDIEADGMKLSSHLHLDSVSGTLNQLSVRLPADWEVDRVEGLAPDPNPVWSVSTGANPTLLIELPRPIQPGTDGQLSIRLRRALPDLARGKRQSLAFPDLSPIGPRSRRGDYVVRVSQAFHTFAPAPFESSDLVGPIALEPASRRPEWTYRFHGQPPAGPLSLSARAPRFNARTEETVELVAGAPVVSARLTLTPEMGAVSSVVFSTSEPVGMPWTWRTVRGEQGVVGVEPFPLGHWLNALNTQAPLQVLGKLVGRPETRWWRLTFTRPVETELVLESTLHAESAPLEGSRPIPLLRVIGAVASSGEVALHDPDGTPWTVEQSGLVREHVHLVGGKRGSVYRFENAAPSMRLVRTPPDADAPIRIDEAELFAVAPLDGHGRCLLRFRAFTGRRDKLDLGLPQGAQVLDVAIGAQSLPPELWPVVTDGDRTICSVPTPGGAAGQRIEVLFQLPETTWLLAKVLSPPRIDWPTPPAAFRTIWRLPPEILPLNGSAAVRWPGGTAIDEHRSFADPLNWFSGAVSTGRERPAGESSGKAGIELKAPSTRTFQQLLIGAGSLSEKPLLDTWALREVALAPNTIVPIFAVVNWDTLGLTLVPVPGGNLLTTPKNRSIWLADGALSSAHPASVGSAVAEAIRFGHDASGRFRTVDDWIESWTEAAPTLLRKLGGDGPGWTAWEISGGNSFTIVATRQIAVIGWLSAALMAAIGVMVIGRLGRWGSVLLVCWLLAAAAALLGLPSALRGLAVGPMLAGLLVSIAAVWQNRQPSKDSPTVMTRLSKRNRVARSSVAGLGIALLCTSLALRAADAEPSVVYLLPGPAPNFEPRTVLAPPELLDRLDLLAKSTLALPDAALLRCRYTGRAESSVLAEFEAQFDLAVFADQATVALPLGDIRLREALLDGAVAYPKSSGKDRLTIDVKGKGEHQIRLKFSVSINSIGSELEARFSTPEMAICRLEFTPPKDAEQVRAVNWFGAQQQTGADNLLSADLGRAKSVVIRWRQADAAGNANVRVQEASLWDLDPAAATLYAAFDYRITQGSVTGFKILLPQGVEVARLEVRPETIPVGSPASWVRDWSVGTNRILTVDLQGPLSGMVRVLFELVPVRPLTNRPTLQFPVAQGVTDSETYVAYRLRRLEAPAEFERKGTTEFSTESFLRDIWRGTGAEKAPEPVTRAFRRGKTEAVQLRPNLQPTPAASRATHDLLWQVGPRVAAVRGMARWSASGAPLTHVEWEVPAAVTINDLSGLDVHGWLRSGNRVIAWLRKPAADVALVWHGTLPRGAAAESTIFEPPPIRLDGTAAQSTALRLRVPDGWVLTPESPASLGPGVPPLDDREIAFQQLRPVPSPRFQFRGPQADALFRVLNVAEVVDRNLVLTAVIEPNLRRERPHSFSLRLPAAAGWTADLQLPIGCTALPRLGAVGDREWLIDVPPRDTDALVVRLNMRRPLDGKREWVLPTIDLRSGDQSANVEERLLLLGPEIRDVEMLGFRRAEEPPDGAMARFPRERDRWRERGGSLWQTTSGEARARVLVSPVALSAAPLIRLGLVDVEAAPLADRWVYRATLDLVHEAAAECRCLLPSGATLEGVAFEGDLLPIPTVRDGFRIPLPAEGGTRMLQIVWTTREPRWQAPSLINTSPNSNVESSTGSESRTILPAAELWSAAAPSGSRLEVSDRLGPAAINLHRADALLKLTSPSNSGLPDDEAGRLASRAMRCVRLADANLGGPRYEGRAEERGPGGLSLPDWSARLRQQAIALRPSKPKEQVDPVLPVKEATFEKLPFADAFHHGVVQRWSGAAPRDLKFRQVDAPAYLPALAMFGLVVLGVAVLVLLTLLLRRSTRPEQMAVLGLIGFAVLGVPQGLPFLGLSVIALLFRIGRAGNRALRWLGG